MTKLVRCSVGVLLAAGCGRATVSSGTGAQVIVIENVTVVTMASPTPLRDHVVVVEDSVITHVAPRPGFAIPRNARRVDGRGGYLIPGLADMHVHLRSPGELLSFLAYGVTTVFNLASPVTDAATILQWRSDTKARTRLGPTIYTTGPVLDGRPPARPAWSDQAGSAAEAELIVRRHREAGYDLIKTYNLLDRESFLAAVRAARANQIPIGGHVPQSLSLEEALSAGFDLIAHASAFFASVRDSNRRIDDARLQRMIALTRSKETALIPTIVNTTAFAEALTDSTAAFRHPEVAFTDTIVLAAWRSTTPRQLLRYSSPPAESYPLVQRITRAADSGGVLLMVGSDVPATQGLFPGLSAIEEIRELERAGLTRYDALSAATRAPGEFIRRHVHQGARFGQVAVGYRADLVLLRRDPMADLAALDEMVGAMVRGRWFTRAELLARRRPS